MSERTIKDLQMMQAAPLSAKIRMTKRRIRDWVNEFGLDGVYVSFSGGKDSTVLLTIARELYPSIKAVFIDTGLEYPEIREFVKTWDNVDWVRPKKTFRQVIEKYGYPFISKEVAECVWGARRYLERVIGGVQNKNGINKSTVSYADAASIAENSRGGWTTNTASSEESQSTAVPLRVGKTYSNRQIWEVIEKNHGKKCGGVTHHGGSERSQESLLLKTLLTKDYTKIIDNFRVQRLMGILPMSGKATMEIIPNGKDRSMFSCERYQFFLDAPFEIGQQCCNVMKKNPVKHYAKETGRKPITAMMATESRLRTQKWLKQGCNAFDAKEPMSMPMAFWTEQDCLMYIYTHNIPIASVYGEVVKENEIDGQMDLEDLGIFELERPILKTTGVGRTGCMFCGFGCHLEKPGEGRFERMKQTHPKQYAYIMKPWDEGGLGYKEVIDWINEHGNLNIRY